jgi:ferredoxin
VRRRFWCNYLCPSGALLSLVSRLSFRKRVRSNACVKCGLCVTVCDFDALGEGDFHAAAECAWCGRCAEVCRTDAVSYAATKERAEFSPTRRDLLAGAGLTAGFLALGVPFGMKSDRPRLRPPGSLPGDDFLARCIRCGLCARVCPGPAISLVGRDGGLATCGTPEIVAERAGCSPACRNCGRVCPTGAIEDLPLDVKNRVIIGTADHLRDLCLPWQRMEKCGPCVDICREAGFNAIEWVRRPAPDEARPTEESDEPDDFEWVPRVNPAKCVGCGLCVQICMQKFVTDSGILPEPAIAVTPKRVQERVDPTLRT